MHDLLDAVLPWSHPQLFTYLRKLQLCYGALACWNATWLVYVPPTQRTVMYISAAILADDTNPTLLRALVWLQLQALRFALRPLAEGAAAAGGGDGGSGGGGGAGQTGGGDQSRPSGFGDGGHGSGSGGARAGGSSSNPTSYPPRWGRRFRGC